MKFLSNSYTYINVKLKANFFYVIHILSINYFIVDLLDKTFLEMWGAHQLIVLNAFNIRDNSGDCGSYYCRDYGGSRSQSDRCYMGAASTKWKDDGTPENYYGCTSSRSCRGTITGCWTVLFYEQCLLVRLIIMNFINL